jgi:hypothetical protein
MSSQKCRISRDFSTGQSVRGRQPMAANVPKREMALGAPTLAIAELAERLELALAMPRLVVPARTVSGVLAGLGTDRNPTTRIILTHLYRRALERSRTHASVQLAVISKRIRSPLVACSSQYTGSHNDDADRRAPLHPPCHRQKLTRVRAFSRLSQKAERLGQHLSTTS